MVEEHLQHLPFFMSIAPTVVLLPSRLGALTLHGAGQHSQFSNLQQCVLTQYPVVGEHAAKSQQAARSKSCLDVGC